jgi:hypothetical protein
MNSKEQYLPCYGGNFALVVHSVTLGARKGLVGNESNPAAFESKATAPGEQVEKLLLFIEEGFDDVAGAADG